MSIHGTRLITRLTIGQAPSTETKILTQLEKCKFQLNPKSRINLWVWRPFWQGSSFNAFLGRSIVPPKILFFLFKDEHHQNYSKFQRRLFAILSFHLVVCVTIVQMSAKDLRYKFSLCPHPLPPSPPSPTNWQKKVFWSACCQTSLEFEVSTFMFIHRKEATYLESKKLYFKGV